LNGGAGAAGALIITYTPQGPSAFFSVMR
jgi:hypothetical protein